MGRKNLTLAIDERLVTKARIIAVKKHTTVTKMIRDHLQDVVRRNEEMSAAHRRLRRLMAAPPLQVGSKHWTRGELHER